jgi:hypothetical protein
MAEYFKDFEVDLSDGTKGTFSDDIEEEISESGERAWWLNIYSNEFMSGGGTPELDSLLKQIGQALYEKLRTAPAYRFAIAGLEVLMAFSFVDIDDLLKDPEHLSKHYQGLVLLKEQVSGTPSESLFTYFSESYRWIPYQGKNA